MKILSEYALLITRIRESRGRALVQTLLLQLAIAHSVKTLGSLETLA